ncbi:MAG: hypothetical protein EAX95_07230 [Candidatus Thorarchaeota archaeon]|nr:hypothetical protein [Candidatus Thorarchaeota archaeon]
MALALFGVLALVTAYIWEKRVRGFDALVACFQREFDVDSVDISGRKKYTQCASHRWIMKNIVHGDYSKGEGSLGDFIGENTFLGTIAIGIVMGSLPVLLVFVMFQSFILVGASMVTIVAAVFIVRSPGDVEVSYDLLSFLHEHDISELSVGDFAYTKISTNRIRRWEITLLVIGAMSLLIAPWGDILPDFVALLLATLLTFFLEQVFLPLASISFPLALVLFISSVPLIAGVTYFLVKRIGNMVKMRRNDITA